MWDLPRPGLEPVSPALAGRFSTTAPPGKPPLLHLKKFFFNLLIFYLLIYIFSGCVGSSLLRTGFLKLQQAGAALHGGARASHCGAFSCCGAQALGTRASVVVAHRLSSCGSRALEHRLSSCGTRA